MRLRREIVRRGLQSSAFRDFFLLEHALSDPNLKISRRAIDNTWRYENFLNTPMTGFNPFRRRIYIASDSVLASWLDGAKDERALNEGEFLVNELLFLVHDYLHVWACATIQELAPKIRFGSGSLNPSTIEAQVFCHLLTEAAATVGLDYWLLSTLDFGALCPVGTRVRGLTTSYRESDLEEHRRFNPSFEMQSPAAFGAMLGLYCSGRLQGFRIDDLRRSEKVSQWLQHELKYGEEQRRYTREWFGYLAGSPPVPGLSLDAGLSNESSWQGRLSEALGERLWRKVKEREAPRKLIGLPPIREAWHSEAGPTVDARFTNMNRLKLGTLAGDESFELLNPEYACAQVLSAFRYSSVPERVHPLIRYAQEKQDWRSMYALLDEIGAERVPGPRAAEPLDLFFPG